MVKYQLKEGRVKKERKRIKTRRFEKKGTASLALDVGLDDELADSRLFDDFATGVNYQDGVALKIQIMRRK